jgi:hypothetical protein
VIVGELGRDNPFDEQIRETFLDAVKRLGHGDTKCIPRVVSLQGRLVDVPSGIR